MKKTHKLIFSFLILIVSKTILGSDNLYQNIEYIHSDNPSIETIRSQNSQNGNVVLTYIYNQPEHPLRACIVYFEGTNHRTENYYRYGIKTTISNELESDQNYTQDQLNKTLYNLGWGRPHPTQQP